MTAGHGANSQQRDSDRDRLVEEKQPLIRALAWRYRGRGEPFEDLVQVGTIGLIKAIDRFDPDRGVAFESYAIPTIVGEIKRHFRDQGWAVHVPRRLKELNLKLMALIEESTARLGRPPTIAELAEAAGIDPEEVVDALESRHAYRPISLSTPVGDDGDEDLLDMLEASENAYEAVDDRGFLASGLKELGPREREILYLRFFEGLTQLQIAGQLGISQMHVSRLIRNSLEKIGKAVENG